MKHPQDPFPATSTGVRASAARSGTRSTGSRTGDSRKSGLEPIGRRSPPPPEGYFTKSTAQAQLDALLAQARQGTLPGMVRTGKRFAGFAEEWLAYCEGVRDCKPSTLRDYRNMVRVLDREFGGQSPPAGFAGPRSAIDVVGHLPIYVV